MNIIDKLQAGAFVKFLQGPFAGPLWKVVKLFQFEAPDNEQWVRAILDKDSKQQGDEIFLEYYPSDARVAYVITKYNEFAEGAQPLPPPIIIDIEEEGEQYRCLDPEATDENNPGYEAQYCEPEVCTKCDEQHYDKIRHWEYQNETEDRILQVILEDGWVEMFTGLKLNISDIQIY
jgi:hypothetical protein